MITRKHFEAIADSIKNLKQGLIDSGELIYSDLQLVIDMVDDMCDMCRQDNPNFDRDKFIKACGFEDGLYPEENDD
jgi:hypothetical protein